MKYRLFIAALILLSWITFPSPAEGHDYLLSLTTDQVYFSADGGASWDCLYIESDFPLHYNDIAIDARNRVMYVASGNALMKSADSGINWERLHPSGKPASVNLITVSNDDSSSIYAVEPRGLYYSPNRGRSWKSLALPAKGICCIAAFSARNKIYLCNNSKIYRSLDNGLTWQSITSGLPRAINIRDMAVSPSRSDEIFLSTSEGLYRSNDGGRTWWEKKITKKDWIKSEKILYCQGNPDVAYMLSVDEKEGGFGFLRRSSNGGDSWTTIAHKEEIRAFAVNPANSSKVYYLGHSTMEMSGTETLFRNIYVSGDSGKNWKQLEGMLPGSENITKIVVRPW
ncbi:MAG: YCF48-related protein [Candidatus Eremiobacteraeota bacterium]|nr:YCF48-related protein [Candidatus Eremiobacteraeota bacterium]